jgi:hypothetical protein
MGDLTREVSTLALGNCVTKTGANESFNGKFRDRVPWYTGSRTELMQRYSLKSSDVSTTRFALTRVSANSRSIHEQLRRSVVIGSLFVTSRFVVTNELPIDHWD